MNPTAQSDQIGAASRDARGIVEAMLDYTSAHGNITSYDDHPGPFAREMIDGIRRAQKRGRLRCCRHLSGRGPCPAWVFGWQPGRLFCHRCATVELVITRASVEDNVCDVCRRSFPKLWAMFGAAGPFLVSFGACNGCFRAETGRVAA